MTAIEYVVSFVVAEGWNASTEAASRHAAVSAAMERAVDQVRSVSRDHVSSLVRASSVAESAVPWVRFATGVASAVRQPVSVMAPAAPTEPGVMARGIVLAASNPSVTESAAHLRWFATQGLAAVRSGFVKTSAANRE